MTVLEILDVWNLFMTRRFIPVYATVYTVPCLKLPALLLRDHFVNVRSQWDNVAL